MLITYNVIMKTEFWARKYFQEAIGTPRNWGLDVQNSYRPNELLITNCSQKMIAETFNICKPMNEY